MATNYNPSIVTDGLVLCLDAANTKSYPGSGTTWTDISGEGHDGTLTNGPTFSSNYGGNIVLDGSNDFVTGVHNSELNLRNDVTIECWFRRTGGRSTWVRIFGKGDGSNRTYGLWYHVNQNYFLYQRYGPSSFNVLPTIPVVLNKWYHMVGTSSGSTHTLYLNGVNVGTASNSSTFHSSTDPYKVGSHDGLYHHIGDVSNCRIYNRGLSEAEVKQNYNAHKGRFGL